MTINTIKLNSLVQVQWTFSVIQGRIDTEIVTVLTLLSRKVASRSKTFESGMFLIRVGNKFWNHFRFNEDNRWLRKRTSNDLATEIALTFALLVVSFEAFSFFFFFFYPFLLLFYMLLTRLLNLRCSVWCRAMIIHYSPWSALCKATRWPTPRSTCTSLPLRPPPRTSTATWRYPRWVWHHLESMFQQVFVAGAALLLWE